jgi:hypothetical protein
MCGRAGSTSPSRPSRGGGAPDWFWSRRDRADRASLRGRAAPADTSAVEHWDAPAEEPFADVPTLRTHGRGPASGAADVTRTAVYEINDLASVLNFVRHRLALALIPHSVGGRSGGLPSSLSTAAGQAARYHPGARAAAT